MAKRKLQRFAENETFSHFFQPNWDELQAGFKLKGNWNKTFFKNNNPLIIEIGCGKGEYSVDLSEKYPDKNFIGIDKKGARMWVGAKHSFEKKQNNIAFLRIQAENLPDVFATNEVDEIWITFPEPHPNSPRTTKRFTSPPYMERFKKILKPNGVIHLKTDNEMFYEYTLEVIKENGKQLLLNFPDLYAHAENPLLKDVISVQTHYEKIWLTKGLVIKYLQFKLCL